MGYMHINNLYKDTRILQFKNLYALEKVHGTSAHISWNGKELRFFSGGMKHQTFVNLFDQGKLIEGFKALGHEDTLITIYGEAYGGKEQGMSATYGKDAAFIAFDVKIGHSWLDVPKALDVVTNLGLEFVPFAEGPSTLEWIDSQRDADSEVAIRRGMGPGKLREGVVLRPLFEVTLNNGSRLITKHKRDEFMETKTPRKVDPEKLKILHDAQEIADEWVTEMRLTHVLQKFTEPLDMSITPKVIRAMMEDVEREGAGEFVSTNVVRAAIGKATAKLYKKRVTKVVLE